jgi:hypothetical protein
MSEKDALKGLNCPRCGGTVAVPEGQAIVICPFCDLRSVVRGENGVRRYQVPNRIDRHKAEAAFQKFLGSNIAIAGSVKREAQLTEVILVHLPFWTTWGRALGWVLGRKKVRTDKTEHYVPKEVKVAQEMTWNNAACDVGEFGVTQVNLEGRPLEAFDADGLHQNGMVFEPTTSHGEALQQALNLFENGIVQKANLDQVGQTFVRILRQRQGLVYYPLWVLRYVYRKRTFQVVVDGYSGEILYGKAPGNLYFRAGVLVGGMAGGAFLAVDVGYLSLDASNGDNSFWLSLVIFAAGLALMFVSYRRYRYGEHYEFRQRTSSLGSGTSSSKLPDTFQQVGEILNKLEKFR